MPRRVGEGPYCFRSAATYCASCARWERTYLRPEQEAAIEATLGGPIDGFSCRCELPRRHPERCDGKFALRIFGDAPPNFVDWFENSQWDDPQSPEDFDLPGAAP